MTQKAAEHDELLANDSDSSIEIPIAKNNQHGRLRRAYQTECHLIEIDQVCKAFKVDPDKGLNYKKIERRRTKYGSNKLTPPRQSKISSICQDEKCGVSMCCGFVIPLILCIVFAILSGNIWIIILSVILFISSILLCIWLYYGERNLVTKYIFNPETDPSSTHIVTVIREHNAGMLISGYWRQMMKEAPVEDIVYIIKDYYRVYFIIVSLFSL